MLNPLACMLAPRGGGNPSSAVTTSLRQPWQTTLLSVGLL